MCLGTTLYATCVSLTPALSSWGEWGARGFRSNCLDPCSQRAGRPPRASPIVIANIPSPLHLEDSIDSQVRVSLWTVFHPKLCLGAS